MDTAAWEPILAENQSGLDLAGTFFVNAGAMRVIARPPRLGWVERHPKVLLREVGFGSRCLGELLEHREDCHVGRARGPLAAEAGAPGLLRWVSTGSRTWRGVHGLLRIWPSRCQV